MEKLKLQETVKCMVGAGVPEPGLNRRPEKPKIRGRT